MADQLVHGVVPADVLAQALADCRGVEQGRGVQTAGAIEDGLRRPQRFRQPMDDGGVDDRPAPARLREQTRTASSDALPQTPQLDDV